ncbi:MAG: adenylyltransferase/cytidyltransferase family protein [Pseudomonadota bacterium]
MKKEISLIDGCFDGFHKGHENLIRNSLEASGDLTLLVAILDDEYTKNNKGPHRPIFPYEERKRAIQDVFPEVLVESVGSAEELNRFKDRVGLWIRGEEHPIRYADEYAGVLEGCPEIVQPRTPGVSTSSDLASTEGFDNYWDGEIGFAIADALTAVGDSLEEMDVPWTLAYGSLLGAVRHHQQEPWDDDIDCWIWGDKKWSEERLEEFRQALIRRSHNLLYSEFEGEWRVLVAKDENFDRAKLWPYIELYFMVEDAGDGWSNFKLGKRSKVDFKVGPGEAVAWMPENSDDIMDKLYGRDWRWLGKTRFRNHQDEQDVDEIRSCGLGYLEEKFDLQNKL